MKNKLWLFYSSIFFQHFAYGIIIPTLIIWQHRNGLSFSQIAIIQSIGLLLLMITEIPSSFFADKIGRKITLISGLITTLFAFIFLIFSKEFTGFLLFQIFFSIGLALLSGTEEAFLDDIIKNNKNRLTHYLGSMSISDELGTIIGMLISSIVIKYFDITASFKVAFLAILFSLCFIFFINLKSNSLHSSSASDSRTHLFSAITITVFLIIMAFSFFSERGEMIYQNRFNGLGMNLESLGLIYVAGKVFSIIGSRLSHFLELKVKTHFSLILSGSLQIIAFILLLSASKLIAIVSLCIFFFSENIFRNIKSSFILKNSPHSRRATNLSLVSFGTSIILIFSKLTIGWTLDIRFLYAIIFVVILKIIAIFLLLKRKQSFAYLPNN
jgi:MFS family permease